MKVFRDKQCFNTQLAHMSSVFCPDRQPSLMPLPLNNNCPSKALFQSPIQVNSTSIEQTSPFKKIWLSLSLLKMIMISNFQQQAHGMISSISDVDDQAKFWQVLFSCTSQSMYKIYLNFSDQNFSLVIVLSLFLIFGQISAWVFLLSLFFLKKSV